MNIAFMYDPYVRNSVKSHYLFHCLGNCVNKRIRYYFVFLVGNQTHFVFESCWVGPLI